MSETDGKINWFEIPAAEHRPGAQLLRRALRLDVHALRRHRQLPA